MENNFEFHPAWDRIVLYNIIVVLKDAIANYDQIESNKEQLLHEYEQLQLNKPEVATTEICGWYTQAHAVMESKGVAEMARLLNTLEIILQDRINANYNIPKDM